MLYQQTGWFCGPASVQTSLQVLGQWIEEDQLAIEMGTNEDGTPSIEVLQACLSQHAHHAQWEAVWLSTDPPTPQQTEEFWTRLTASHAAGFAVPGNWVSPENNHPIAVLPGGEYTGQQPNYRGTIYHYVCYTASADVNGQRYVGVSDSGFSVGQPYSVFQSEYQYWVTLEQCMTLMPPKGYVWASAAPIGSPGTPTLPGPAPAPAGGATADLLYQAMGGALPLQRYAELLPAVLESLAASDCTNETRVAEWMAQIGHESGGLAYQEEIADGSAYEGREDLGNVHPGDGPKYKGHGWIQITGYENTRQVSEWAYQQGHVGSPTYFLDYPEQLGSDQYAGMGAAWYWTVARPKINAMADARDHDGVCRAVNGGLNGYDDRVNRFDNALPIAASFLPANNRRPAPMPAPTPVLDAAQMVVNHLPGPAAPAPAPAPPPPAAPAATCLTGRPHHHSENSPSDQQLLDIRAEGLITQRLVYELALRAGLDAAGLYQETRDSF
jgi:predicted chitinase